MTCAKCPDGKTCAATSDCASGFCNLVTNKCVADACSDGEVGSGESDVDCGGPTCAKCGDGKACGALSDCASGFCNLVTNKCVSDSCSDGAKNAGETGVDCGGPTCGKCGTGEGCLGASDCTSTFCNATTKLCVAAHCQDAFKDLDETDVDCGGPTCGKCAAGGACNAMSDCASGLACHSGVCTDQAPPSSGLVGYWPLEGGPSVPDQSGNGNTGTVTGGVTFGAGKIGNAGTFATNGCVAIKSSASLEMVGNKAVSVMAWVNYAGACTSDNCTFWNKENQYEFAVGSTTNHPNSLNEAVQTAGSSWSWTYSANGVLTTGAWTHVALVWDNVNVTRYVDGLPLADTSNPRSFSPGDGFGVRNSGAGIGCRAVAGDGGTSSISSFFNGSIDEMAVYDRALTAVEIKAYFDATK
jgi:hypothetical protein